VTSNPSTASAGRRALGRIAGIPLPAIFLACLAVGFVLLWRAGTIGDTWEALEDADGATLLGGALLYLIGLAVLCLRWHLLVVMIHGTSNLARASEAFLTSVVINYAAPIGLAVPSRAALTKRSLGLTLTETSAIALWEVGVDVLVLGVGTLAWIALGGYQADALHGTRLLLLPLGLAVALAGGAALLALARRLRPVLFHRVVEKAHEVVRLPARDPRTAALTVGVTAGYWAMQALVLGLMLDALDVTPRPVLLLGLTTLPILVGMLSPFPGGAGIRELLMVGVAGLHGAAREPTLLAGIVYRVALFASIPILYLFVQAWLFLSNRSGRRVQSESEGGA
jgi:uncharacterized membrane protein YbhN (UPF0104 family)